MKVLSLFDRGDLYTDRMIRQGVLWRRASVEEVNGLLAARHYLGPLKSGGKYVFGGFVEDECVAAMIWRHPTSRRLPQDGTWLELSRNEKHVTTLVSYSDPEHGHTGALYRACNWKWAPTWLRLRPPPSGNGSWGKERKSVKDRWVFELRADLRRAEIVRVKDDAIVKRLEAEAAAREDAA